MCMQCVGAATVGAGAATTGLSAWVRAYAPRWVTPARRRAATVLVLGAGVLAAGAAGPALS